MGSCTNYCSEERISKLAKGLCTVQDNTCSCKQLTDMQLHREYSSSRSRMKPLTVPRTFSAQAHMHRSAPTLAVCTGGEQHLVSDPCPLERKLTIPSVEEEVCRFLARRNEAEVLNQRLDASLSLSHRGWRRLPSWLRWLARAVCSHAIGPRGRCGGCRSSRLHR